MSEPTLEAVLREAWQWTGEEARRRRIERLAQYKAERERGIVHTFEWDRFMGREQEWFDALPFPR